MSEQIKLTAPQEAALAELWRWWPDPQERRMTPLKLAPIQGLKRRGLADYRHFYENTDWPPRATRESDHTWEAWLTPEGEQEALRRGYLHHTREECAHFAVGSEQDPLLSCQVHRRQNPVALPVLRADEKE